MKLFGPDVSSVSSYSEDRRYLELWTSFWSDMGGHL